MACPGSRPLGLLALCLALSGCRLNMVTVELNTPMPLRAFDAVEVGSATRSDVLERLGPPDRIHYTLDHEVLEWEAARHRGTDIHAILPTQLLPFPGPEIAVSLLISILDPFENPDEFAEPFAVRFTRFAMNSLVGLNPVGGTDELMSAYGRDLRLDRVQVLVNRHSRRVDAKQLELAGEPEEHGLLERIFVQHE